MAKIKLFTIAALMLIAATVSAQWSFVGGVVGAGTFPSISVYGPNGVVIAGGPNGTAYIARSTNGGANFTLLGNSGTLLELYCVWARSADTIFAGDGGASGGAGGNAHLYRTVNGGVNWTVVLSTGGSAGFINGVVFSKVPGQTNFGVAQSDPPTGTGQPYWVAITSNAGANWTIQNPPGVTGMASSQNSIVVIDNLWYGFGGNAGASRVIFTSNGGTTWNTVNVGVTGSFMSGFSMNDNKLQGVAASNSSLPNIGRTTNGGTSFSPVNTGAGGTAYCNLKWIHGSNLVYLTASTGSSGIAKRSTDGGLTWSPMTTSGLNGITHMEYYKETIGNGSVVHLYAVSGDGSVIRYRDSSLMVGIDPNNQTIPTEYKLEQNYPNPFNPSTTINYAIPFNSNVVVKVYNISGQEVATLANGWHTAGNYTETFNASNLSSGIYFYTLSVEGKMIDTKKMTLVK
jgi:hypothetical protein